MHEKPIGWDGQAAFKVVNLANNTWTLLLEANERRIAWVVGPTGVNTVYLAFDNRGALATGLQLNPIAPPFVLSRYLHGGLVTRSWYAFQASGAPLDLGVMESFAE